VSGDDGSAASLPAVSDEAGKAFDDFYAAYWHILDADGYTVLELFAAGYAAGKCDAGTQPQPQQLPEDVLGYLLGLVRADIRKRQKDIDGFSCRPGQDLVESQLILEKFISQQEFRYGAHKLLREASKSA